MITSVNIEDTSNVQLKWKKIRADKIITECQDSTSHQNKDEIKLKGSKTIEIISEKDRELFEIIKKLLQ